MNMQQIVNFPTHGFHTIDHVWVSENFVQSTVCSLPSIERKKADKPSHASILVHLQNTFVHRTHGESAWRTVVCYNDTDFDLISAYIIQNNLAGLISSADSADHAAELFNSFMHECIANFVPTVRKKANCKKQPQWFNQKVCLEIAKRNKIWKRMQNAESEPEKLKLSQKYAVQSRLTRKAIKNAKKDFLLDRFGSASCQQELWKAFKTTENQRPGIPDLRLPDNVVASSSIEKAQALADQFDFVWDNLRGTDADSTDLDLPDQQNGELQCFIDVGQTLFYLSDLKVAKSPGCDAIPPILYQRCSFALAAPVAILINRTIREGVVPLLWKKSVISPVPKRGDLSIPSNWRPVNMLNVIDKIAERHIHSILRHHIVDHLHPNQFGFLEHRSTEDALLFLDHMARSHMSIGKRKKRYSNCLKL
jgi:hypothetical protein